MPKREYQPYQIPRRNSKCCECSLVFIPEGKYCSVLQEDEEGAPQRHDYCIPCWEKFPKDHQPGSNVMWQSTIQAVPVPAHIKGETARCERALELLRQYSQGKEDQELGLAYILALYLDRRKKINFKKEIMQGTDLSLLFFEVSETEEMIAVPKIPLNQLNAEHLQSVLAEQLGFSFKVSV